MSMGGYDLTNSQAVRTLTVIQARDSSSFQSCELCINQCEDDGLSSSIPAARLNTVVAATTAGDIVVCGGLDGTNVSQAA